MKRARAWTTSPEPEAEQARMRVIREARRAWGAFVSIQNKRDRAALVKDIPAREQLDLELARVDRQLVALETRLATLDRQCEGATHVENRRS